MISVLLAEAIVRSALSPETERNEVATFDSFGPDALLLLSIIYYVDQLP